MVDLLGDIIQSGDVGTMDAGKQLKDSISFLVENTFSIEEIRKLNNQMDVGLDKMKANEAFKLKLERIKGECSLLLAIEEEPWRIIVSLFKDKFGSNFNVLKKWYDQYGIFPSIISHDIVEMRVPKKIKKEEIIQIAIEYCMLCPEILELSTAQEEEIIAVALELYKSFKWYLWWD